MKKIILASLISLCVLSTSGCFDDKGNVSNSTNVESKSLSPNNEEQNLKNKEIFSNIINETNNISIGDKDKDPIVIFFDPQCIHCHELFNSTQHEDFKNQHFIWVPVGFLNENSLPQAETIISSIDPQKSLFEHEKKYGEDKVGILPISIISKEAKDKIAKNNAIFEDTKLNGVPVMIKIGKDGTLNAMPGGVPTEYIKDFINK